MKTLKKIIFKLLMLEVVKDLRGKIDEPRSGLRRGCIIGSKNLPFKDCINAETTLLSLKTS